MSFYNWGPKPTVAERRRSAETLLAEMKQGRNDLSPVVIEGRKIAASFWGKAWCDNLESYSDYANRLPRGRSYVRNSCVIDLQIGKGEVTAQVRGSSLYKVKITVTPLDDKSWSGICRDCAGSIDSVVELLQGRLSKAVMERVCRSSDGLFPVPKAIKLSCSCPDGAYMCKHVAATLYGVGARLDSSPELLFRLRGVDQQELIAHATAAPAAAAGKSSAKSSKVLDDADLSSLFGLNMEDSDERAVSDVTAPPAVSTNRQRQKTAPKLVHEKQPAAKHATRSAKKVKSPTSRRVARSAETPKQSSHKKARGFASTS